jgi:CBS domain-containing protein
MGHRRLSSSIEPPRLSESWASSPPPELWQLSDDEADELLSRWQSVLARDIIDTPFISVEQDISVEQACETLLSSDNSCLAVKATSNPLLSTPSYLGLFDFADVNAFLTFAATRHILPVEQSRENQRFSEIISAARTGHIPVKIVSNLSEKNPLETLPNDSTVKSLLEVFSQGAHRVLIENETNSGYLGFVSDRGLLSWIYNSSAKSPLERYLANAIRYLTLPSLDLFDAVVSCNSSAHLLDAMSLMSEEGVSSIAVLNDETGTLLSAVSVTDIARIVVPSPSSSILSTTVGQFVSLVKHPDGAEDGVDKFPVYSVVAESSLGYTIQKLLATNSHRLFVTSTSPSGDATGMLSGIVSIVDTLCLFASLVNIVDIDPKKMQRHRRMSSSSSHSAHSRRSSSLSLSRQSSRQSPVQSNVRLPVRGSV